MFNKPKEKQDQPLEKKSRPMRPSGSSIPSIIGSDIRVVGNITTPGEVQLDGIVEGEIVCGSLTIGEHGLVTGTVKADTLHLRGSIEGKLRAKTIHFERTAKVKGDVTYETMTMEAGVQVEGKLIPMNRAGAGAGKPITIKASESKPIPGPAKGNGQPERKSLL